MAEGYAQGTLNKIFCFSTSVFTYVQSQMFLNSSTNISTRPISAYNTAFMGLGVLFCLIRDRSALITAPILLMSDGSSGLQRFQTTGHGWEGLGAPERQGGKVLRTQPPAYRAHRPSGLKVIVSPRPLFFQPAFLPFLVSSLLNQVQSSRFFPMPLQLAIRNKKKL